MKSMTGYGRAEKIMNGLDILVEIRSVNHRYFEFSARFPKAFGYLEIPLKKLVKENIQRGKIEISVYINHTEGKKAEISVNEDIVMGYIDSLRNAAAKFNIGDDLKISTLATLPDVFNIEEACDDEKVVLDSVIETANEAIDAFENMRSAEGENLKKDILSKLDNMSAYLGEIETLAPKMQQDYYDRLYEKLLEILDRKDIDESRIIEESAIFADKVAIDEETVRLRSHIGQMRDLVNATGTIGKKLDFLVQEMNRETNTIGSKATDIKITNDVVNLKSEIEKIREQIQNVE